MALPTSRVSALPSGGERHAPISTNGLNECAAMERNLPSIEDPIQFRTQLRVVVNHLLAFTTEIKRPDDDEGSASYDRLWEEREKIRVSLLRGDTEPRTPPVHKEYFVTNAGIPCYVLSCGTTTQEVFAQDSQWAAKELHREVDLTNQRRSIEVLLGYHAFLHGFLDWGGVWTSHTPMQFTAPGFTPATLGRYVNQARGRMSKPPPEPTRQPKDPVEAAFALFSEQSALESGDEADDESNEDAGDSDDGR